MVRSRYIVSPLLKAALVVGALAGAFTVCGQFVQPSDGNALWDLADVVVMPGALLLRELPPRVPTPMLWALLACANGVAWGVGVAGVGYVIRKSLRTGAHP